MVIRRLLRLTLRAIGCADVRFGILPTRATILSGTLWTAAGWPWSAIARKGLAHGWAKQSPRTSRCLAPRRRAFCVSGGERWWTNPMVIRRLLRLTLRAIGCADVRFGTLPTRATKLSGTILDSRRLAPERISAPGFGPWMGQTIPRELHLAAEIIEATLCVSDLAERCDLHRASTSRLRRYAQPERFLKRGFRRTGSFS